MSSWIYIHNINPVLFSLGPLRVGWYGLMYALSFTLAYLLLLRQSRQPGAVIRESEVANVITYVILGVVLGGRLGWVIFYGGSQYLEEPWRVIETWKGGMSFHGGMIGMTLAVWLYSRRHKLSLLQVADSLIVYAALGLGFGRIGNFINGELYGKPTGGAWGVVFPGDRLQVPRHPSQLYEGLLEGFLMAAVLWSLRGIKRDGLQPAVFLLLYGVFRTAMEFVRLPDADIGYLWGGFVTMGMVLSAPMALAGLLWVILIMRGPAPTQAKKR